jgi:hypothetical protein
MKSFLRVFLESFVDMTSYQDDELMSTFDKALSTQCMPKKASADLLAMIRSAMTNDQQKRKDAGITEDAIEDAPSMTTGLGKDDEADAPAIKQGKPFPAVKTEGVVRRFSEAVFTPGMDASKQPFHKILLKHGFQLSKTNRDVPNYLAPQSKAHWRDEFIYTHPQHGKSHVAIWMYHNGDKTWLFRYEQSNGIMAPSTGNTAPQLDKALSREFGGVVSESIVPDDLDARVIKVLGTVRPLNADQVAEKISYKLPWGGVDATQDLHLQVSYALARLADAGSIQRIGRTFLKKKAVVTESEHEVDAHVLGLKPIKGKNRRYAYPASLEYGGRSWTSLDSGAEQWNGKTLEGMKYRDQYGNILTVKNTSVVEPLHESDPYAAMKTKERLYQQRDTLEKSREKTGEKLAAVTDKIAGNVSEEEELCPYCNANPPSPQWTPYCSGICAISAERD